MTTPESNEVEQSSWARQLRKGVLDLAILASLWKGRLYGLEIIKRLKTASNLVVVEGTIYPILKRLDNDGFIQSEWEYESGGHPRKYYSLTPTGRQRCRQMHTHWEEFSKQVRTILKDIEKD